MDEPLTEESILGPGAYLVNLTFCGRAEVAAGESPTVGEILEKFIDASTWKWRITKA